MYLKLRIESDLKAPGRRVWNVLNDFGGHYKFNPLIELSPITNGIEHGLGAEREVQLYDGSSMLQTILDFVEGESMLIGFTETNLPITHATAKFTVEPPDREFCHVRIDVSFEPKLGMVGALIGSIFKPVIRYRYNLVLRGLEYFVRTDSLVRDEVPETSASLGE